MDAMVKIGDIVINIHQQSLPATDPEQYQDFHTIILTDVINGEHEVLQVANEPNAIQFLRESLELDGPPADSLYRKLVRNKAFLP